MLSYPELLLLLPRNEMFSRESVDLFYDARRSSLGDCVLKADEVLGKVGRGERGMTKNMAKGLNRGRLKGYRVR